MSRRAREIVEWRRTLIDRRRLPSVSQTLGRLLAERLFGSSNLALHLDDKPGRTDPAPSSIETGAANRVFGEPYTPAARARLGALLGTAAGGPVIDLEWKLAIECLNFILITRSETVLHGELDTGAVLIQPIGDDAAVKIAGTGQACRGPIAFDLGTLFGSLFLNYFAQGGYGPSAALYRGFVVDQLTGLSASFSDEFSRLWRARREGAAFRRSVLEDDRDVAAAEVALTHFLEGIELQALAFAGADLVQRVLAPCSSEEIQAIADPAERAAAERRALAFGRSLMTERLTALSAALEEAERVLTDVA